VLSLAFLPTISNECTGLTFADLLDTRFLLQFVAISAVFELRHVYQILDHIENALCSVRVHPSKIGIMINLYGLVARAGVGGSHLSVVSIVLDLSYPLLAFLAGH
jgi:hypothetical protein